MRGRSTTTAEADIERRWAAVLRWHPYGLLAVSAFLAVSMPQLTPTTAERSAVAALVVAALALQLCWARTVHHRRGPDAASVTYYLLRCAIGVALTWLNPFFAFYAAAGYFDAPELFPGRSWRVGVFVSSLPVAAVQAGGVPFTRPEQWGMFVGLLLANNALLSIVNHFVQHMDGQSRTQAATIEELERTNAALQRALDENAALQAQLVLQAKEAGVAEERRRLAAEIHDTIAQGLTGIITQLQVVANTPDPAAARTHLGRACDLARHSLGEARRSVHNLAPVGLAEDGLPGALRTTAARWSERSGIRAEFTLIGAESDLHSELSATLLRITQEALANAAKHAAPSRVGVTLSFMDDEVTVDIRDDGRGFDPLEVKGRTRSGGFGLDGMRARAARVAGSVTVESEEGHGTAISASVPLIRREP